METGDGQEVTLRGGAADVAHHVLRARRVETGDRFVGEEEIRVLDQRAGDTDALLLATTHVSGALVCLVEEADRVERTECLVFVVRVVSAEEALEKRRATECAGQRVTVRAHLFEEVVLLEDHRDVVTRPFDGFAVDGDRPGRGLRDSVETAQQRRLSRPRLPQENDELTVRNSERDVVQRLDTPVRFAGGSLLLLYSCVV